MNIQKKLKVFLIEDAAKIRSILIEILHQTGQIEVVGFAESERDALQQLRSREWDVAIVDIGLREGTGLGVLKGLKSDGKAYGKRFLFSSNSNTAFKNRTLALGADGFFDKARDMDALVSQLQAMVHWNEGSVQSS
jgi:DNA-binding NarL/FixJ family response regulator